MLEEEGVLRCCLYVLLPSAALVMVVTVEKVGPKVVSILVPLLSGEERLAGPPEKRL